MSIEKFLGLIRNHFSPTEGQILIKSLQQDPLVWQFVKNEALILPYFEAAPKEISAYSPGKIFAWIIEKNNNETLKDPANLENPISESLRQQAAKTFETTLNTGLPPSDLLAAGLLAISLRERRILKGSWEEISKEIFTYSSHHGFQKNFSVWQTAFACLYEFCPDFDAFIDELFAANQTLINSVVIPAVLHTYLANPNENQTVCDLIFAFTKNLLIDQQLESLKWLKTFLHNGLCKNTAKQLMQTKNNVDFFRRTFTELERFNSTSSDIDPIIRPVSYTLPEDVNRLAAFYYYLDNQQKAGETYQKSTAILKFIEAQLQYQSFLCNPDEINPTKWIHIINAVPHSKQVQLNLIQSLLTSGKSDEASKYLQELPPSQEKKYLEARINMLHGTPTKFTHDELNPSELLVGPIAPISPQYYIQNKNSELWNGFIKPILKQVDKEKREAWYVNYLDIHFNDITVVKDASEYFESINQITKAIELTSYLERVDPENNSHQRNLARLYGLSDRWEEAFKTLQGLIKTSTTPEIVDLECFALAALKTSQIELARSVCENILKQNRDNTKAQVYLGRAFMFKGDIIKAIQHMEQVIEKHPEIGEAWLTLADIWDNSGQADRAIETLRKGILILPQEPLLLHALGKAFLANLSPTEALTCLIKVYEFEPENPEVRLNLASARYQTGQYQQARELLAPFVNDYQNNPLAAKLLGHILLAMGDKKEAEPVLIAAASFYPDDQETILSASQLVLDRIEAHPSKIELADFETIEKLLQEAQNSHQDSLEFQRHLADILRLKGETQKAFAKYKILSENGALEHSPSHWRLLLGMGKAAITLGNKDIGLALLKEAVVNQPENLSAVHSLAQGYLSVNLGKKAKNVAKTALKLAPHDENNIIWYAKFEVDNNEPEEATKAIEDALIINPENSALRLFLVETLLSTGKDSRAKETLTHLINNVNAPNEELHRAAHLCLQINELDLAIGALEKSRRQMVAFDQSIIMDLGILYALQNKAIKALEVLEFDRETLAKHPQLVIIKSELLTNVGHIDQAYNLLREFEHATVKSFDDLGDHSKVSPQSPLLYNHDLTLSGYYFRLGQLAREMGEIKQAQNYLTKALSIDPDNLKIRNATAEVFLVGLNLSQSLMVASEKEESLKPTKNSQDFLELICLQAEIFLLQNELEEATEVLNKISQIRGTHPRFIAIQSSLAAQLGEFDIANEYYNEAVDAFNKLDDLNHPVSIGSSFKKVMTLSSLAQAALQMEHYQIAIEYYKNAYNLLKNQPLQNYLFAHALTNCAEKQQIARALLITQHAPGEQMLSEEHLKLTQKLLRTVRDYPTLEPIKCLNARAIAAFSGNWPLNLNIDACLIGPDQAAAVLISTDNENLSQDILAAYPENLQVLQAYGIFALRNKRNDAKPIVKKALEQDITNPMNHALLALLSLDEPEESMRAIETALNLWPDEALWHNLATDLYTQVMDTESAADHIAQALKTQPKNVDFLTKSAEIKFMNNDFVHAKNDLEKSAAIRSDDPKIWLRMADINRRLGNISEAIDNFQTAVDKDPDDMDTATQEIRFLIEKQQLKNAETKAQILLENNPSNSLMHRLLAISQAKQGKFDQAIETITKAIEIEPSNVSLALEKLKIKSVQGGIEGVLPELLHLADQNPTEKEVLTTLTEWLIQTNRLKEAEQTAQTIMRILPDQADVYLMLGRLQRKKGQLDQAIAHFSDAIIRSPNLIDAYIELGKTYQERRDIEQAIKTFQKGSQIDASDPRPYYFAGMALKECKDYSGAEEMLRQSKKYAPNDATIIRQLGMISALNLINNLRETR